MLPLVRADLAQSIEKNYDAAWVVTYAMALGDVASIPVVLAIERKYPHTEYAARAVDVLLQRDPQHARKAIEDAIALGWENPTSATRSQAADLAYLSAADAISLFERLWPRASTSAARHELFAMLVHFPDRDATPIVFKHYPELDSNDLRGAAIERFGNELYEPAIPLLGDALKSSSDYVRNSARDAFKKFKDYREALEEFSAWMNADKDSRASIAELSKLLESNNRDVVIGAVHSLAAVKARSALPALVKLLERPDPELKKAVEEAIARIGGG
jgi:HEAT repeat protein